MTNLKAPTLIDVVARHEQEIQELKRLITPMMGFNPEKPLTYDSYDSPGPSYTYAVYPPDPPKEWVGLTDEEIGSLTVFEGLHHIETPLLAEFIKAIEAKLRSKNT